MTETKKKIIPVYVTVDEKEEIKENARKDQRTASTFLRLKGLKKI